MLSTYGVQENTQKLIYRALSAYNICIYAYIDVSLRALRALLLPTQSPHDI